MSYLPGVKSLLWRITVQLLQLGACVLCKLSRVVLDLVPAVQKIEISLNNFGDDESSLMTNMMLVVSSNMMLMVVIVMEEVIFLFSQLVLQLLVILGCSNLGDHPLH